MIKTVYVQCMQNDFFFKYGTTNIPIVVSHLKAVKYEYKLKMSYFMNIGKMKRSISYLSRPPIFLQLIALTREWELREIFVDLLLKHLLEIE